MKQHHKSQLLATMLLLALIFSTATAQLRLVAPQGGTTITNGTDLMIRWAGVDSTTPVRIEYSQNSSSEWRILKHVAFGLQYRWRNVQLPENTTVSFRIRELRRDAPHGPNPVMASSSIVNNVTKYFSRNTLFEYYKFPAVTSYESASLFDIDARSQYPIISCVPGPDEIRLVNFPFCALSISPDEKYLLTSCLDFSRENPNHALWSLEDYGIVKKFIPRDVCNSNKMYRWSKDSRYLQWSDSIMDIRTGLCQDTSLFREDVDWQPTRYLSPVSDSVAYYITEGDTLRSFGESVYFPVRWITNNEYRTLSYKYIQRRNSSRSVSQSIQRINIKTPVVSTIDNSYHRQLNMSITGDTTYLCSTDGNAYMIDTSSNIIRTFHIPTKKILHINSNGKKILVHCGDSVCYIFNTKDSVLRQLIVSNQDVSKNINFKNVRYSYILPDNRYAAIDFGTYINIVDYQKGTSFLLQRGYANVLGYYYYNSDYRSFLFSPLADKIAFSNDTNVLRITSLRDTNDNILIQHKRLMDYEWHPTGKVLVTVGLDSNIIIWNPMIGRAIDTFKILSRGLHIIHWSKNGRHLYYSTLDSTFVLDVETRQVIDKSKGIINRNCNDFVSPDEQRVVLLDPTIESSRQIWHRGSPYVSGSADSTIIPIMIKDNLISVSDERNISQLSRLVWYSNGKLYIDKQVHSQTTIHIYTAEGQLVDSYKTNNYTEPISLQGLSSGVYFVSVVDSKNYYHLKISHIQ